MTKPFQAKQGHVDKPYAGPRRSAPQSMALEQRFMFDGAGVNDAVDAWQDTPSKAANSAAPDVHAAPSGLFVTGAALGNTAQAAAQAQVNAKDFLNGFSFICRFNE